MTASSALAKVASNYADTRQVHLIPAKLLDALRLGGNRCLLPS